MKQDDRHYEEWLAEIRGRQPVMSNPDELAANILQRVARTSSGRKKKKLLIVGWLSGIAAGLLLSLLVSETLFTPVPYEVKPMEGYRLQVNDTYSFSLPEGWEKMRLSEKSDYLSGQYIQFRKLRRNRVMELTKRIY
ncbi:hypothetical protein [Bacteroides oleiciplenus]|uniref:hypothetical protein n=1 Tax=Bacteroides oleiciplenus TaxID=626931 RepID=UPI0026DCD046|nr:hypothetical protein [Bacteroides oleiciplenus]